VSRFKTFFDLVGVRPRNGGSEEELQSLERRTRVTLPDDFRSAWRATGLPAAWWPTSTTTTSRAWPSAASRASWRPWKALHALWWLNRRREPGVVEEVIERARQLMARKR
jgi:hypothetical protein